MAAGHTLVAPGSLVDRITPILQSHGISCTQIDKTTVTHGRRETDLVTYKCVKESANVELAVEKRRERDGVNIVLIPSRRVFFLEHVASEELAERINSILCDNGADETP